MIRKFECKGCGKSFSSEEREQVKCPHCGCDNVDYASVHIPYKFIGLILVVILAVTLLMQIDYSSFFSSLSHKWATDTTETSDSISGGGVTEENNLQEVKQEIAELGIENPPTIKSVERMELDNDGKYNVVVRIEHAPEKDYCVQIIDMKTNKVVAKSNDGVFKGVPFSENEGKYYAKIVNASTNEPLSTQTEITGFIKVQSISNKLSMSELQDLINNQDASLLGHDNEYLSPVCKIKYTSLPKGLDEAPDNLADVFEMLDFGSWTAVEVSSVEYDKTKHISSITLKVKEANQPNF